LQQRLRLLRICYSGNLLLRRLPTMQKQTRLSLIKSVFVSIDRHELAATRPQRASRIPIALGHDDGHVPFCSSSVVSFLQFGSPSAGILVRHQPERRPFMTGIRSVVTSKKNRQSRRLFSSAFPRSLLAPRGYQRLPSPTWRFD
jgi:hypothetical protein